MKTIQLRDRTIEDGGSLVQYFYLADREVLGGSRIRRNSRVQRIIGHGDRRGILVAMRTAFSQIRIILLTGQ